MKTYVMIGIFHGPGSPTTFTIYRGPDGRAPEFGSYQQADRYIRERALPAQASPIELTEFEREARKSIHA